MTCCLTALSHYLSQYWLIISKFSLTALLWHREISQEIPQPSNTKNLLENYLKLYLNLPGAKELTPNPNLYRTPRNPEHPMMNNRYAPDWPMGPTSVNIIKYLLSSLIEAHHLAPFLDFPLVQGLDIAHGRLIYRNWLWLVTFSHMNAWSSPIERCQFPINSVALAKFEWNFRYVIFQGILVIEGWGMACEIALIWMSLDFTDYQSTLVQVMAWCHQATSHYLS